MSSHRALFDLSGRTAIVTGGSRGLGKEIVLAFAEHGANVVVASRKLDNCEAVALEARERFGVKALPLETHVGYWEQVEALAERAYAEFGSIEILVNNAGMSPLYPSLSEITETLYDKVMAVNLKGTFRLTAIVGERMTQGGGGSIISLSSGAAIRPTPNEAVYAMAKAGLHNMTEMFSKAYGPKVRVNCIMPGPFLTDISKAWDLNRMEKIFERSHAMARAGQPNEIIGAALYFASDASSFTTGAILKVDGGWK